MMRVLMFSLCCLWLISCNTEANQTILERYENNLPKLVKIELDSSELDLYIGYHENGSRQFEMKGKNGFVTGEKVMYDEEMKIVQVDSIKGNNCLWSDCCCQELSITRYNSEGERIEYLQKSGGQLNGLAFKVNDNGEKTIGRFRDGMKEGRWQTYLPSGRLKMYRTYQGDILNGRTEEYLDSFMIIGQYRNGLEDGKWIVILNGSDTVEITRYEMGEIID